MAEASTVCSRDFFVVLMVSFIEKEISFIVAQVSRVFLRPDCIPNRGDSVDRKQVELMPTFGKPQEQKAGRFLLILLSQRDDPFSVAITVRPTKLMPRLRRKQGVATTCILAELAIFSDHYSLFMVVSF